MTDTPAWSSNFSFIFKKIWVAGESRFLTFKEMLEWNPQQYASSEAYKRSGFEVIDNTPEEIRDAVIEKEERIRGSWQANEEYEDLQRRFWALWQPNAMNQVFRARIGSKFLLQNSELI